MIGRSNFLAPMLAAVAVMSFSAAGYLIARTNKPSLLLDPQSVPPIQPEARGDSVLIGAVGLVEPSSQPVKIGTEISGVVTKVFVSAGAVVKRGDALFALDSRISEANLLQRERDLAAAVAQLDYARAKLAGFEASVDAWKNAVNAAEADLDDAQDLLRIADRLKPSGAIADRDATRRRNGVRTAEARVAEARSRLRQSEAECALYDEARGGGAIRIEAAAVDQAEAAVAMARTDLAIRMVRAPIDAAVLQVNLRPGEFAQAGVLFTPLMVLGRIDPLYVRVEFDEADIPRFATRMTAIASVRGDGARKYWLQFVRIEPLVIPKRSLTGDVTERVDTRVMQVLYEVRDGGNELLPGQQLDVFIESSTNVISELTPPKSQF